MTLLVSREPVLVFDLSAVDQVTLARNKNGDELSFVLLISLGDEPIAELRKFANPMIYSVNQVNGGLIGVAPLLSSGSFYALGLFDTEVAARRAADRLPGIRLVRMPATLGEAIATEPLWLQAWLMALGVANLGALLFVVGRREGRWVVRPEPIAILASFLAAGVFMSWLYGQVGYVRLLGLAHLASQGGSGGS